MNQSRCMFAALLVVGSMGTDLFAEAEPSRAGGDRVYYMEVEPHIAASFIAKINDPVYRLFRFRLQGDRTVQTLQPDLNGGSQQAKAEAATPRSAPDEQARRALQALIAGLGDPRFPVREAATSQLQQCGIEAVEPLAAAAGGERLEVTCRAIRVLGHYLESGDDPVFDAAERALEGLEESSNRSAARRAADALVAQSPRRWKRAAVRIRDLGGELRWTDRDGNPAFRIQDPDRAGRPFVVIPPEWKGGDAGLVNLKRMARQFAEAPLPSLPSLYLIDGAPVSPEAIDRLRDSLPSLDIQRRGAARLGVSCASDFRTCRVSGVEPESPAQKAGILPNDEIVTFDGEALMSEGGNGDSAFGRLIQITGRHKAGDKVEIEVMRSGKRIKIEAELIGWTSAKPNEEKK